MNDFGSVINQARSGANEAAGELLEPYRNYLRAIAAAQLGQAMGQRVSPSDIVQDAMLAAHQNIASFRGESASEFTVWLRTILNRCLMRAVERNTKAEKRDIRREVSVNRFKSAPDASSICALSMFVSKSQTPSQIVSGEEEARRISRLLLQLSRDYQEVIALRNFENLRFEEIARRMSRSEQAVRLLWLRAVRRLRDLYQGSVS